MKTCFMMLIKILSLYISTSLFFVYKTEENLYSTHPFYECVEDGEGNTHGVLLYNSNAMGKTARVDKYIAVYSKFTHGFYSILFDCISAPVTISVCATALTQGQSYD